MRAVSAIALALCSVWLCCQPAFAAKRVALVIGNSAYERVPQLQNPARDASAMSQMFRTAGFDAVTLKLDLKASEMRRALRDFADEARDADTAIIYFAGHGLEIQGINYLIPVDAVLERDIDAPDEAVPLDRLLNATEPARQLRLVILDACRDNPFAKSMKRSLVVRPPDRGLTPSGGLASVEPTGLNTLIAFAAKAGSKAADGDTSNSPFTAALIKYLPTPGLDLRKAFGFVRDDVLKATHNEQEPFIYGSLGGNDVPLVPKPPAPAVDPDAAARADYERASGINMVATWDSFIKKYPSGFYSDLAKAQRDKLTAAKAAEDARAEAARKTRDEAARAEADARQKALVEAAEAAARIAAKKLAEEAAAAERPGNAVQAVPDTKAVEAPRVDAAPAKPDDQAKLAALLPTNPAPGQQANAAEPTGCAGASAQLASRSADSGTPLSMSEECGLRPKHSFRECENCPEMVVVPGGAFLMGSSKEEIEKGLAAANESPQHKVVLGQAIAVGRFEVTRDQYAAFVNATGHQGSGRCFTMEQNMPQERENRSFLMPGYAQQGNEPAVCVSWTDAQAYADWLTGTTGKSYRLPSEAEYEYAARAGGTARFGLSDDPAQLCRFANGADQSAKAAGLPEDADYMACTDGYPFTAPVGSFAANAFGLNDLIGNVWEWTADCFADNYSAAGTDGAARAQAGCSQRAVRGGDWFSTASLLRPAVRAKANPDSHYDDIGFRVVRTLAH